MLREKYFIIFVQVAHHRTLPQAWSSLCNYYKLHYFCFRLHDWYDPASVRTHSLPHQQFVRQESPCEGHHVLDTQPVLPLGCESAPWQLSEATHDRSMWLIDEVQSSETVIITNYLELVVFIFSQACLLRDRGSTVVKALCYKLVGRWFDPSWCQWIFHWHKILPIALCPWGRLSL